MNADMRSRTKGTAQISAACSPRLGGHSVVNRAGTPARHRVGVRAPDRGSAAACVTPCINVGGSRNASSSRY